MDGYGQRTSIRVPLKMPLNGYIADAPEPCLSMNLGRCGIYVVRWRPHNPARTRELQLEFELPGTAEVIWARGEVAFDRVNPYVHGTGVRFVAMASKHWSLIRDYVAEQRLEHYRALLERIGTKHN